MSAPSEAATSGLTVADVMHAGSRSFDVGATVGELRDWFAGGTSRRLALVTDTGRHYVGAVTEADVAAAGEPDVPAVHVAQHGTTLDPGETAAAGRDAVLRTPTRRVPVVDRDGCLVGVLALTNDARSFSCDPTA